MADVRWFKIDSWHVIKEATPAEAASQVSTLCGLERPWDGTFKDSLPGGAETSCENCLIVLASNVDEVK